jgi:NADH-quinone oxidoreductase subunit J
MVHGSFIVTGMRMLSFTLLSVVMIVGALGVITLRQPVHAALSLVGTLLTLAVTYVMLQAHFLAAIQVIVYAGAIMVLFLFVIMLLNAQGDDTPSPIGWVRFAAYPVALVAVVALLITIFSSRTALPSQTTIDAVLQGGGADAIGEVLFSQFILAFQLVGVLLLTGIIGAVALVQRRAVAAEQQAFRPTEATPEAQVLEPSQSVLSGKPDDLKRIKGIGPKLERLLNENAITTFAQIAALDEAEVEALDEQLHEFRGRIRRDGWLEQARELSRAKEYA